MREDQLEQLEYDRILSLANGIIRDLSGIELHLGLNAIVVAAKVLINSHVENKEEICLEISDQFTDFAGYWREKNE